MMPEQMEFLYEQIPCRKQQIDLLLQLIGEPDEPVPQSLFIYGHTSTGKSFTVETILKTLGVPFAVLNCVECYMPRLIYEPILNQISETVPCPSNDYLPFAKCDNMSDFVRFLRQAAETKGIQDEESIFIILDKAERLRDMDANVLPSFLRLQELCCINVCVILISEIIWDKFRSGTGFTEPIQLHFPQYTKDEMTTILLRDCPVDQPSDFYRSYINLLIGVFFIACRNLSELRHMAKLNFSAYCEPVKTGEVSTDDIRKLWRNIEPHFKKSLETIYLREISSNQWEQMKTVTGEAGLTTQVQRLHLELPFYSKFLLVAAYLASYNPASSDRRFFMKHHVKQKKTTAMIRRKEKSSSQLLGPKAFPLDRLMAIFYSIVEGRVAPTANIFCQIMSLVTLQLLTQVGAGDPLEAPKYKCAVGLDFIRNIARTVNFNIMRYLYDFA